MTITNKANLPQPLVDAVTNDPYDSSGSDCTVTKLIQPPRKVELERRHAAEISEDASERIWALMGQLGHLVLERAATGAIVEKRLFAKVNGWSVSGQLDLIPPDAIVDYKFTSIWAIKDGVKPEWEQQLNLNRWLCWQNGINATRLEIVAILRDWSKPEAARNKELPQQQVVVLPVKLWELGAANDFMLERVALHQQARRTEDEKNLHLCTSEEMWERPPKFAVKKNGAVRAIKLYDTMAEAEKMVQAGQTVEIRRGERPRCEHYCNAAEWCGIHKEWKAANNLVDATT